MYVKWSFIRENLRFVEFFAFIPILTEFLHTFFMLAVDFYLFNNLYFSYTIKIIRKGCGIMRIERINDNQFVAH